MVVSREQVFETLKQVKDPVLGGDIVSNGVVGALTVSGGTVQFVMEISPSHAKDYGSVKIRAESAVLLLPDVDKATIVLTGHAEKAAPPDLKPANKPDMQKKGPESIPGVAHIVAVASGKGGVGKSTVSANLACALAQAGRRVGLLDADVYGPSQPRMLGISGRPASPDGKVIIPLRNHGVTMMSLGLMTPEDQAVVWRGPMLMGALQQMLFQVQWGDLDVLIVDLPPGTGDVQMTLAQKVPLDGAIIVSTPQDVALLDARKSIDMFNKMFVPLLGMIENMSTHICSQCGHEEHVFGNGGVAAEATKLGVPLLGELPLDLATRLAADDGVPIVVSAPQSAQAKAFQGVAAALLERGVA